MEINKKGRFYVVATPIGNREDISLRAIQTLKNVDLILAEDTRHSRRLLDFHGISTSLRSCHEHNEEQQVDYVLGQLASGKQLALISDAGTPLISDPGYILVKAIRNAGHDVIAIPGPSAAIAALSIAGLATNRVVFEGFLPAKSNARKEALKTLLNDVGTLVLYESTHRIREFLNDLDAALSEIDESQRTVVLARELTKQFETVLSGSASDLIRQLHDDANQTKGEFVVLIEGTKSQVKSEEVDATRLMNLLLDEMPLKKAAAITAKVTGLRKNELYERGLKIVANRD
ncbi:MAG: 16S rRNA (cytidine(1402)-2'-O)-methyltransferase [Pseudomonadota bacterium]